MHDCRVFQLRLQESPPPNDDKPLCHMAAVTEHPEDLWRWEETSYSQEPGRSYPESQLLADLLLSPLLCGPWQEHQPGSLAACLRPASNVPCVLSRVMPPPRRAKSAQPSETLDAKARLTAAVWYPPTYFHPQDSNHTPLGGCCCLCTDVNHVLLTSAKL